MEPKPEKEEHPTDIGSVRFRHNGSFADTMKINRKRNNDYAVESLCTMVGDIVTRHGTYERLTEQRSKFNDWEIQVLVSEASQTYFDNFLSGDTNASLSRILWDGATQGLKPPNLGSRITDYLSKLRDMPW